MYIYIPGTCLSFVLGVEPSKRRPFPIKTKGHHLGSRYNIYDIYIYIYIFIYIYIYTWSPGNLWRSPEAFIGKSLKSKGMTRSDGLFLWGFWFPAVISWEGLLTPDWFLRLRLTFWDAVLNFQQKPHLVIFLGVGNIYSYLGDEQRPSGPWSFAVYGGLHYPCYTRLMISSWSPWLVGFFRKCYYPGIILSMEFPGSLYRW